MDSRRISQGEKDGLPGGRPAIRGDGSFGTSDRTAVCRGDYADQPARSEPSPRRQNAAGNYIDRVRLRGGFELLAAQSNPNRLDRARLLLCLGSARWSPESEMRRSPRLVGSLARLDQAPVHARRLRRRQTSQEKW